MRDRSESMYFCRRRCRQRASHFRAAPSFPTWPSHHRDPAKAGSATSYHRHSDSAPICPRVTMGSVHGMRRPWRPGNHAALERFAMEQDQNPHVCHWRLHDGDWGPQRLGWRHCATERISLAPRTQRRERRWHDRHPKSTLAEHVARAVSAPAFARDWLMGALKLAHVALAKLDRSDYLAAWFGLLRTLVTRQLMLGQSAVVDDIVSDSNYALWRETADRFSARLLLIECICSDEDVHRARPEGRVRGIPGWHEVGWDHVHRPRVNDLRQQHRDAYKCRVPGEARRVRAR